MGTVGLNHEGAEAWGPPRRVAAGTPPTVSLDLAWAITPTFQQADASPELGDFARLALSQQGLKVSGALVVLKHGPGDRGLPALSSAEELGFAIDLTDARRTLDGGLLLFVEGSGRVSGWRAEAGMMTVWSGADPDLTELAPGSPHRLTLVGRARRI